jgi:hypothetical protein
MKEIIYKGMGYINLDQMKVELLALVNAVI